MIPWWAVLIYAIGAVVCGEAYDHGRKLQKRPFIVWQYLLALLLWWVYLIGAIISMKGK